jgi:hypothetical protein
MELTPGQITLLKRATGKEEITLEDYYRIVQELQWDNQIPFKEQSFESFKERFDSVSDEIVSDFEKKLVDSQKDIPPDFSKVLNEKFMDMFEETSKPEYILCSAIHFDDGEEHLHSPKNISSGFVLCGRRHHNIFAQLKALDSQIMRYQYEDYSKVEVTQGFLTSEDRFVERDEAGSIAFKAGQIKDEVWELFSEDLW